MTCLTTLPHEPSHCVRVGMGWGGVGWHGNVVWEKGRKIAFQQSPRSDLVMLTVKLLSNTTASSKIIPRESGAHQYSNRADQWEKAEYCLTQIGAAQF